MRSRHVKKFRWRAEEKLVNSGEDICVRPAERMQDPAANTAPGYCDDDEVCGEEGGSHRSRATTSLQSWRPPKALPTIRLANKNPKTQTPEPHTKPLAFNHGDEQRHMAVPSPLLLGVVCIRHKRTSMSSRARGTARGRPAASLLQTESQCLSRTCRSRLDSKPGIPLNSRAGIQ